MLISFSVSNFRSFKSRAQLSLNETGPSERNSDRYFWSGRDKYGYVSRVAGIFGPNGSGKSNLVTAMLDSSRIIEISATKMTSGDRLPYSPFSLDDESKSLPSEFEYVFKVGEDVFRYGFTHNSKRVLDEWLYSTPLKSKTRQRRWFSRTFMDKKEEYDWYVNEEYISNATSLVKGTRSNSLFLSSAVRDNSSELEIVYTWFRTKLIILGTNNRISPQSTSEMLFDDSKSAEIKNILKRAGLDFDDIVVSKEDFKIVDSLPKDMPSKIRDALIDELEDSEIFNASFLYKCEDGKSRLINVDDQSTGTQLMFGMAWPLVDVLESHATLIIDELNNSLHPHLTQFIIDLFNSQNNDSGEGQLIFTSHEPSVMKKDTLSVDQIWFMEGSRENGSSLYNLSDFSDIRSSSYYKQYLGGRFGAVPNLS